MTRFSLNVVPAGTALKSRLIAMLLTLPPAGIATTPEVPVTVIVPSRLTAVMVTLTNSVVVASRLVTPTFNGELPALSETDAVLPVNWFNAGAAGGATMLMVIVMQLMSPPACKHTSVVKVPFGVVVNGSTVTKAVSVLAPRVLPLSGST